MNGNAIISHNAIVLLMITSLKSIIHDIYLERESSDLLF